MAGEKSESLAAAFPRLTAALGGEAQLPAGLAAGFPRILKKIDDLWGSAECDDYLGELLFADRSDRQGFDDEIVLELLRLQSRLHRFSCKVTGSAHDRFSSLLAATTNDLPVGEVAARPAVSEAATAAVPDKRTLPAARARWPLVRSAEDLRQRLGNDKYGKSLRDPRKFGEIMVGFGVAESNDIECALEIQRLQVPKLARRDSIGRLLVNAGAIEPQDVIWGLCIQQGVPIVDLELVPPEIDAIKKLPLALIREKRVLPILGHGKFLAVASRDPLSSDGWQYIALSSGMIPRPVAASAALIDRLIEQLGVPGSSRQAENEFKELASRALGLTDGDEEGTDHDAGTTAPSENDATIIGLVNKIINDAVELGASDIHFEGFARDDSQIRLRRDGAMERYSSLPRTYHPSVVSRIKIMSDLDISERRRPQDGKISFRNAKGRRVDLRVAVIPTLRNIENITIRILQSGDPIPLDKIGMAPEVLRRTVQSLAKPFGLILVCGPTGSGKTTTLHSALAELNTPDRKIWTAEDPVEIVQKNVSQVQVNARIGCTFASILRSFLRADPDVIMIGEMRDQETARIAVEASMTGHLVLSTLHTNSAAETVARLLDLGVDPFNFSDALLMILAQRLTRRLCPNCRQSEELDAAAQRELAAEYHFSAWQKAPSNQERERLLARWRSEFGVDKKLSVGRAVGCKSCGGSGYWSRLGVHEHLVASPEIKRLIRSHADGDELQRLALDQGMRTLKQDSIEKALQGQIDLVQVRAACI